MFSLFNKNTDQQLELTISNRTIIRVLAMVLVFIGVLAALRQVTHALVLIFVAFFLTLALNAPVHWIDKHLPGKHHKTRSLATIVSVLAVLLVFTAFLAAVVPPISRQTGSFINAVPRFVHQLNNPNSTTNSLIQHYHLQSQVNSFSSSLTNRLRNFSGQAVSTITHIGSSLVSLLTILVLTFMMLVEGPRWVSIARRIIPEEYREHVEEVTRGMYKVIKGYVNGQVILALLAAGLVSVGLAIFDVPYPFALIFVVFVAGLIPMIGHTIGAIVVASVAYFHSASSAIYILIYYIVYQQIENYLIQPRLQATATQMSPLLVFIAVVLGISFGGLIGALVAIPTMGCVRIIVLDQLTRRNILVAKSSKATVAKAEAK